MFQIANNKTGNKKAGILNTQNNDETIKNALINYLGVEPSSLAIKKTNECLSTQSSTEKKPIKTQNSPETNQSEKKSSLVQPTSFFNSQSIPLIIGGTIITLGGLYGAYKILKASQQYIS